MSRFVSTTRLLAMMAAACVLCAAVATAGKPDTPGGGGGGGSGGGDNTAPYTIVPFSPPGVTSSASMVFDLSDQGHAVGVVNVANTSQAVHLDTVTGVYTLMAGVSAIGVNNFNQIVGEEVDFSAAFWATPAAQSVPLPPLPGDTLSRAIAINDAGIVVGWSEPGDDEIWEPLGVVWRVVVDDDGAVHVNGPQSLGPLPGGSESVAADINEFVDGAAQATGWDRTSYSEALVWTIELNADGTLIPPGPPEGLGALGLASPSWSRGNAIDNFGNVCGVSDGWPFVAPADDSAQMLPVTEDSTSGYASDLNDSGQIVGALAIKKRRRSTHGVDRAFLWSGGQVLDLATQIDGGSGWERLDHANQINNAGIIAGQGVFDIEHRGFLMIPDSQ